MKFTELWTYDYHHHFEYDSGLSLFRAATVSTNNTDMINCLHFYKNSLLTYTAKYTYINY